MQNKIGPASPPQDEDKPKLSVVQVNAGILAEHIRFAAFRGRPMLEVEEPYKHFVPLTKERFDKEAYPKLGGKTRGQMSDVFAYVSNVAPDLTGYDHLILFGDRVWDMRKLEFTDHDPRQTVWRSPYRAVPADPAGAGAMGLGSRNPFIMSLAGGDAGLYDDILQSLAPLVMERKPDGVVWWVGAGANGKSTLMDAIYHLFPGQLSSLTVKALTEGKDTPRLNGTLANVVKESSEGRIEDTEVYKSVGTHEDFTVHKFHSQDTITIRGNMHHIFSGNSIPTFNDKGWSARRRTFVVPFTQRFQSDPNFERRTFVKEMFESIVSEMCKYAVQLREQQLRYKWSAVTLAAKLEYDVEANNAEEYARAMVQEGIVGFEGYGNVKMDYENWCLDRGYVPLGIGNVRKAMKASGFERRSVAEGETVGKKYLIPSVKPGDLQQVGMSRPGMYTMPGFTPPERIVAAPVPETSSENEPRRNGKW